ncbi:MED20 family protein [Megaselia abdita]
MPQPPSNKAVHILHNSEFPASTFSILDTGAKHIPLVADNLFDLLMIKIGNVYTQKKQPSIESKGPRFEYGDFLIKLGSVTMNGNFKGILIEFEYRPCIVFLNCWELMRELIQGFLGISISSTYPQFFQQQTLISGHQSLKQNDSFQAIDTINQYLEHFINYRKQTTSIGGSTQITGLPLRS